MPFIEDVILFLASRWTRLFPNGINQLSPTLASMQFYDYIYIILNYIHKY